MLNANDTARHTALQGTGSLNSSGFMPVASSKQEGMAGILLLNYGEPVSPDPSEVRSYLYSCRAEAKGSTAFGLFRKLSALSTAARQKSSATKGYERLWTDKGFFYDYANTKVKDGISTLLREKGVQNAAVLLANRHSSPSIQDALLRFKERGIKRVLLFPLLPQYSYIGNGGMIEEAERVCKKIGYSPEIRKILDYHSNSAYASAVARLLLKDHLYVPSETRYLFIYSSVPYSHLINGDVYEIQTGATSLAIAKAAGFERRDWTISYLPKKDAKKAWLGPSVEDTLRRFADAKVKDITLVCPGFPVDRSESLLEVADLIPRQYQRMYAHRNGDATLNLRFVHALNGCSAQLDFLTDIIIEHTTDWLCIARNTQV